MPSAGQHLAESHGSKRDAPAKSLWGILQEGAKKNPDGLALACPSSSFSLPQEEANGQKSTEEVKLEGNLEWSFSQLSRRAELLASTLRGYLTCDGGGTIVPFLASGPEWALLFWTAAKLNMPIAALDPKVLLSRDEETQNSYLETLRPRVIVVLDDQAALAVDSACERLGHQPALKIIVTPGSTPYQTDDQESWKFLHELLSSPLVPHGGQRNRGPDGDNIDHEGIARILFTGGSTGHPKGCPHTHANLTAESDGFCSMRGLTSESRTLIQSPVHHIMANAGALLTWRAGGGVVFPFTKNQFDAGLSIQAIQAYKCTYLPVHHSMSDAILRHPAFNTEALASVLYMQIGGALIGLGLAKRYEEFFGVAKDGTKSLEIFPFWGSTEGMYTTACAKGDALITDNPAFEVSESDKSQSDLKLLAVGRSYDGGRVKVVDPETGATLPRGYGEEFVGELHFGGDTVIKSYLGGRSPESFYVENGHSWFRTGDQGRMAPDGSVFMLGRYKDMIKRGGENIFAQQLEYTLHNVCGIRAQIVGVPDVVTGEGCVAVVDVSKSQNFSKLQLQLDVSKHIGPDFLFVQIFTLEDLGLAEYPLGPGGKVRKALLRDLVLKHPDTSRPKTQDMNGHGTLKENTTSRGRVQDIDLVKSIWAGLLHVDAADLDNDFRLEHFTDSLTSLRYCFEVERYTTKRLTLADVRGAPTIRDQALLISGASIDTHVAGKTELDTQHRAGPPSIADVQVCRGQVSKLREIQELARSTLGHLGLTWERDVQDCFAAIPLWEAVLILPPLCFNLRFAFEVDGLEVPELREALASLIKTQPLLASTAINLNNKLVYLQLRQSDKVIDNMVTREPDFESVADAVDYGLYSPDKLVPFPPGTLSRFGISAIHGQDSARGPVHVLTVSLCHAVCDAMTNTILFTELDSQLSCLRAKKTNAAVSVPPVSPKTLPYNLYCDMYNSLYNSISAENSSAVIASRFRGIASEPGTYWPPTDHVSIAGSDAHGRTRGFRGVKAVQRSRRVPGLLSLQDAHGIHPSVALKVAYGLTVMQKTGKKTALYLGADAARHWPFLDSWAQSFLPNPLLVGGPMVCCIWQRLRLGDDDTSLLEIFRRVRAEDLELAPHTHLFSSHERLTAQLDPEDRAFARETRCFTPGIILNHVPDIGRFTGADGLKAMKFSGNSLYPTGVTGLLCGFDAADRELAVITGLADETMWQDVEKDVGGLEDEVLRTLNEIVRPENWEKAAVKFAAPAQG